MTTREAFEQLISTRGWYKPLGMPEGTAAALKNYFKRGKVSLDKMEDILTKSGFTVKQEKLWER